MRDVFIAGATTTPGLRPGRGPLTLLMCSPVSDGASALVLASDAGLRRLDADPVRVLATVILSAHGRRSDGSNVVKRAAPRTYADAGMTPNDVDLVELHDAVAPAELIVSEEIRIAQEDGGRVELLRSGASQLDGRVPINPSGGLLARVSDMSAPGCPDHDSRTDLSREESASELCMLAVGGSGDPCRSTRRCAFGYRLDRADPMPAGHQVAAKVFAAADQIAQRLIRPARERHRSQLAGRVQPSELERVALIGLGVIAGLTRHRPRKQTIISIPLGPPEPDRTPSAQPHRPPELPRAATAATRSSRRSKQTIAPENTFPSLTGPQLLWSCGHGHATQQSRYRRSGRCSLFAIGNQPRVGHSIREERDAPKGF